MLRIVVLLVCLLCASAAQAATFWVAQTGGDDGRSCTTAQTEGTPKATINSGKNCLQTPGDILIVKAGTYAESLLSTGSNAIVSGTSWEAKMTIRAHTGDTVWMTPASGNWVINFHQNEAYIEFDGINLDGSNVTFDVVKLECITLGTREVHHIRFKNAQVIGNPNQLTQTFLWTGNVANCQGGHHADNLVVDVGGVNDFDHGFYVQVSNTIIENSEIYDAPGAALHYYNGFGHTFTNTVARNNIIRDGRLGAAGQRGWGIICDARCTNLLAYNNVIWNIQNTAAPSGGITVSGNTPTGIELYNNTIVGNASHGIRINTNVVGSVTIRNNISWANGTNYSNGGTSTTASNNLGATATGWSNQDPLFVDEGADDFHITSPGPAIDAGFDTSATVTTDFDGVNRPQNGVVDIGAYEFVTGGGGGPGDTIIEIFDTAGTDTFTWPTGVTQATAEVIGGGGGGKGGTEDAGGGGGGGAGFARGIVQRPMGDPAESDVTVGAGGTGGSANGGNGTSGGQSFFGSATTVRASGGGGSTGITGGAVAGNGTHGTDLFPGGAGGSGNSHTSQNRGAGGGGSSAGTAAAGVNGSNGSGANGGAGGTAPLNGGNGGAGGTAPGGAGTAGTQPGGGGGGGSNQQAGATTNAGGNGADGIVIVTYVLPIPTAAPNAPSNLLCSAVSFKQINCGWDDNADDEDGFEIERCSGSGCSTYALIRTTGSNVLQFSDTNLPQGTTWRYRIRAFNAEGDSAYATASEATTTIAPVRVRFGGLFR